MSDEPVTTGCLLILSCEAGTVTGWLEELGFNRSVRPKLSISYRHLLDAHVAHVLPSFSGATAFNER